MKDGVIEGKRIKLGVILSVIPLLLAISVVIALYLGATEEQEELVPMEGEVTVKEMEDYLNKLTYLIGPRNIKTEEGQQSLRSAAAMIEGTLGAMNVGFEILQKNDPAEGLLWRTIWVEAGEKKAKEVVMITVPYGGEGSEVAYALGLGEYFTKHRPKFKVKLVFYPPLEKVDQKWLKERVIQEGETLAGSLAIKVLGNDTKWATLSFAERAPAAERIMHTMSERKWLEYLNVPVSHSNQVDDISVTLHWDSRSPLQNTAERFLRMLPVVKVIADKLVK